MESQPTGAAGANKLKGLRIVAFESRMAAEVGALIERYGATPTIAPSMREVALSENAAARDFATRLLAGEIEVAIFLTGVGVRALFQMLEDGFSRPALVAALSRTVVVARGPKASAALRDLGIPVSISIPEPNTWREVLTALTAKSSIAGKTIAIQEYGVSNHDLVAGLEARGARALTVPVYRWALPDDRAPLRAAIEAVARGELDVMLFTSATQVANVLQVAEAEGLAEGFRHALATMVVGSVGPVCSEAMRSHGLPVDVEPSHPKLGHLMKEIAERGGPILERKRSKAQSGSVRVEVPAPKRAGQATVDSRRRELSEHPLMKACRREATSYTPIWLMRQAGRYMPEYRKVRDQHDFIEMCRRPELAAEVTVTAVERLGVDAGIIFSDILIPLLPMGVGLHYEKGDGPIIDRPVGSVADLEALPAFDAAAELSYVGEAIKLARAALKVPLIGFAGAPFTLASYLIEGGGSRQYQATKTMMYKAPELWDRLMELLSGITVDYLKMQIGAGADVVQLFDSWVGSLGPDDYRRFVLPHTAAVIRAIPANVPVIHFGTVTGNLLELMREAGGDVIGLDWRVELDEAWKRLGYGVAVQGNLDPIALFAEVPEIRSRAKAILDQAGGRPGHIFNLGHGILPETPVDHVIALIDAVHEISAR